MSSSPGLVIPRDKLNIWKIFRSVGPEAEEILKIAKLAHVFSPEEAYVVTTADETYSFLRTFDDDEDDSVLKIAKVPQLSGVRVKEFVIVSCELAITEDGSLYSWLISDLEGLEFKPDSTNFALLGRLNRANYKPDPDLLETPHRVLGSLKGKKVDQVASSFRRAMALTVAGEVHQWGEAFSSWTPNLVPKQHFHYQNVTSIACSDDISVALTSNGELFQWKGDNKVPEKVVMIGTVKKISASSGFIFVLTIHGALYLAKLQNPVSTEETKPVWTVVLEQEKFHDIATSGNYDDVILELKNNTRFLLCYQEENYFPRLSSFSQSSTSIDEFFAEHFQATYRTLRAQTPLKLGTVGDDIASLWGNKENSEVTFSLEGKAISAHKCILSCRSEYFAKMFANEWKKAKKGSVIEIKDTKYEIFEALLFYVYNDKIKFGEEEYENIFELMMLADAYCDLKIRHDCEKILIRNISAKNAFFLVRNASLGNASDLERNVVKFILDERLIDLNSSAQELIDTLGMNAFQKISMAALHRV